MQLVPRKVLFPRKDKTVTVSVTETLKVFESTTVRETLTLYVNVTVFSTIFSTETQFSTMNFTATATATVQPPSLARLAPVLTSPLHATEPTVSPPVTLEPAHHPKMQTGVVLGVVLGSLAFLACIIAALFFLRRFHQRYRAERVARKQAVTEGNELPDGLRVSGTETVGMRYSGTAASFSVPMETRGRQDVTGNVGTEPAERGARRDTQEEYGGRSRGQQSSRWPRDEKKDLWEELPPAYS